MSIVLLRGTLVTTTFFTCEVDPDRLGLILSVKHKDKSCVILAQSSNRLLTITTQLHDLKI